MNSHINEYLNILSQKAKNFFKSSMPLIYKENINVEVLYFDKQEENGGVADVDTNNINLYSTSNLDDFDNLDDFRKSSVYMFEQKFSREILDTFILVHEMAHKYYYKLLENNESNRVLKGIIKSSDVDTVENIFYIRDNSAYRNFSDMFARSIENMYANYAIFSSDTDESTKEHLKLFMKKRDEFFQQTEVKFDNTIDESYDYTNENQFFTRAFEVLGEQRVVNWLKNIDLFKLASVKRTSNGKLSEEYMNYLANPYTFANDTMKSFIQREDYARLCDLMKKWNIDNNKYNYSNKEEHFKTENSKKAIEISDVKKQEGAQYR